MKKVLLVILLALTIMPTYALAADKKVVKEDYHPMNLIEVLEEEKIEPKFKDYKETEDQITIYLFRGTGCSYCKAFLNFLNSITEEYGKYFKLEAYEVWNDSKNSKLMEEVADFLDESASGVPYIIIGDTVFPGYAEQFDEGIKTAIKQLYESENRYDIFEEMGKAYDEANKKDYSQTNMIIACNAVLVVIATTIIVTMTCLNSKKITKKMDELNKKINEQQKEEIKEIKKENDSTTKEKTVKKSSNTTKKTSTTKKTKK
ncbi:MAG: hypothetical protein E7170_00610 [Firmicutes bacterium]|nr:hypothetical protein [Bacillota bacterium]